MIMRHGWALLLGLMTLMLAGGCEGGGYTLRAKVIEGPVSGVTLVSADDPRLNDAGLAKAWVAVYRDPEGLKPTLAGGRNSNDDGTVLVPVKGFGAGWMQEQWLIEATLQGHEKAATLTALPSNSKKTWMLITLTPGTVESGNEDFREQIDRFK